VVLSDVDSRCQLRRHLAQLCADDVVLFHNTHTHTHTHTRINQPALHLKHPLLLNLACTASSGLHKLPITMQCSPHRQQCPTPDSPDKKGPSKPHNGLRKKKFRNFTPAPPSSKRHCASREYARRAS
jgi:hypothetical protein